MNKILIAFVASICLLAGCREPRPACSKSNSPVYRVKCHQEGQLILDRKIYCVSFGAWGRPISGYDYESGTKLDLIQDEEICHAFEE